MIKYILKRILLMIPLIICVAIVIFTLMYFVPGDPAVIKAGSEATSTEIERIREELGLNDPYIVRLGNYLYNVFIRFDFGESLMNNTSITEAFFERLPRTLTLTLLTLLLTMGLGIPLGIVAAVNPNTWKDKTAIFVSLVAVSVPPFWFALILIIVFALNLNWLPALGIGGFRYYILPTIANSVIGIAMQARQTRSSMLEAMNSDYIVTCRAKGLPRRGIIYRHALPNASIPIITESFFTVSAGIAGSVVIENVFSIPGIGQYLINGINTRDYTIVEGTVILIAIMTSILNLLVDLVYAFVDPRIKANFEKSDKRKKEKGGAQNG